MCFTLYRVPGARYGGDADDSDGFDGFDESDEEEDGDGDGDEDGDSVDDDRDDASSGIVPLAAASAGGGGGGRPEAGVTRVSKPKSKSRDPKRLVMAATPEEQDEFVDDLCGSTPLSLFSRNQMQSVGVRFYTKKIEHRASPRPENCWCHGLGIDEENLDRSGLAGKIEKRLMLGKRY